GATQQFLDFTHVQYKKHVGDEFGNTFLGFRGDEPDYGFVPWTPELPNEFMKQKGYDVRPWVASFMIKNPTDSMLRVKADYWNVWSDLFGKNFFKVQADWCASNNLQYMVHLNHEDKMMWLARSEGDFFEDLRHVQIPGVDAIWNQIWPGKVSDYPKYASSVAHVYGHPRSMSESFAAYRPAPNVDQAKWVVDYQFARGINFFEWMYWPASTRGDGSPHGWFADPKFPHVAQYSNRISYLLSNGTPAAKIAVYYPTDSEWLGDQQADSTALKLSQSLLESQHDFDFLDDHAVLHVLSPSSDGVRNLSGQVYQTILIPSVSAMPKEVLDKLKYFSKNGVKVVFTSQLPSLIAGKTYRNAGHSYDFSPMIQTHDQDYFQYLPTPDFKMANTSKAVKYNHRHFSDGDLYFIFNEGESPVNTKMTLGGKGEVERWNAVTGETRKIESEQQGNSVQLKMNLAPWETKVFVVSSH
ncbi:MAG TPA: glycosyl hydrolase, partial [Sunxiuqinia sp.]|nr:glycosyl hydrolase [Sunxiuqinia sp.]